MILRAFIDGGCIPNPGGTAAYGLIVFEDPQMELPEVGAPEGNPKEALDLIYKGIGNSIHSARGIVGKGPKMSNNVAEYFALVKLFEWILDGSNPEYYCNEVKAKSNSLEVIADSQLLVNHMTGMYKARGGLYMEYYLKAKELELKIRIPIKYIWIARRNNLADELATQALADNGIFRNKD